MTYPGGPPAGFENWYDGKTSMISVARLAMPLLLTTGVTFTASRSS
jgi:hypothetical protein